MKQNIWKDVDEKRKIVIDENTSKVKKPKKTKQKKEKVKKVVKKEKENKEPRKKFKLRILPRRGFKNINNRNGWFVWLVLASLVLVTSIVLPIALIFGFSAEIIDNMESIHRRIGFDSSNDFSIKHVDTGKYIGRPENINEHLNLVDEPEKLFKFSNYNSEESNNKEFVIETDVIIQNSNTTLMNKDSKPMIGLNTNYLGDNLYKTPESQLDLEQNSNKNEFAIYFRTGNVYLGNPDENGNIDFSNKPVWYQFETETEKIETAHDFLWNALIKNKSGNIKLGVEGNTFSIYEAQTNNYLKVNQSDDEDSLSKGSEYLNFFIASSNVYNRLGLGYYKEFEEDKPFEYPLLTSSEDSIYLERHLDSVSMPTLNQGQIFLPSESVISFEQNPSNLYEMGIFFEDVDKYLAFDKDKNVILSDDIFYWVFEEGLDNPEDFKQSLYYATDNSAFFDLDFGENFNSIERIEIKAKGYPLPGSNYPNNELHNTGWEKIAVKSQFMTVSFTKLPRDYLFNDNEVRVFRKTEAGNHVTTIELSNFITNIEIDPPELEDILPENKSISNIIDEKTETTSTIEISFKQGSGVGHVSSLGVNVIDRKSGELVTTNFMNVSQQTPEETVSYEFQINNLTPNTNYLVTTTYNNVEQEEPGDINNNEGIYQIYISTKLNPKNILISNVVDETTTTTANILIYFLQSKPSNKIDELGINVNDRYTGELISTHSTNVSDQEVGVIEKYEFFVENLESNNNYVITTTYDNEEQLEEDDIEDDLGIYQIYIKTI